MRVGIAIILEPDKNGERIEVRISLVTGRLKDSYDSVVNELQESLLKEAVEGLRPKKGSSIKSVTLSTQERSVTLGQKE